MAYKSNPLFSDDERTIQERRERLLSAFSAFKSKYEERTGERLTLNTVAKEVVLPYSPMTDKAAEQKVSKWLRQPESISADELKRLCDFLDVSTENIINGVVERRGMMPSIWFPTNEVSDRYSPDTASRAYGRLVEEQQEAVTVLIGSILEGQNAIHSQQTRIRQLEGLLRESFYIVQTLMDLVDKCEPSDEDLDSSIDAEFIRRYRDWDYGSDQVLCEDEYAAALIDDQIAEWEELHPVEEAVLDNDLLQQRIFPKGGSQTQKAADDEE